MLKKFCLGIIVGVSDMIHLKMNNISDLVIPNKITDIIKKKFKWFGHMICKPKQTMSTIHTRTTLLTEDPECGLVYLNAISTHYGHLMLKFDSLVNVSLFNSISIFVGYLMPKPSL